MLVVSAVEGVQAQTRLLMRTPQRLRIPTLVFVNKIDRRGADTERVLRSVREKPTPSVVAMGSAGRLGTRGAFQTPYTGADADITTRPVRGAVPSRPRTDHDPLNRKEYLLRVLRRTGGRREGA